MKLLVLIVLVFVRAISITTAQIITAQPQYVLDTKGHLHAFDVNLILTGITYNEINFLQMKCVSVKLNNVVSKDFSHALQINQDEKFPVLHLLVNVDSLSNQGTYEVTLRYTRKGDSLTYSNLVFNLNRPAAVLESLSKEIRNVYSNDEKLFWEPIVLRQTSNRSRLTKIYLSNIYFPSAPYLKLTTKDFTQPLEANINEDIRINYNLESAALKKLPIGKYTGTLQVFCDQTASPLSLTFVVTKKRANWVILAFIALGLATGIVVKKLLPSLNSQEDAKRIALDLLKEVVTTEATITDPEFKKSLNELITGLNETYNKEHRFIQMNVAALQKKTEYTQKEYLRINEKYNKKIDEIKVHLNDLTTRWKQISYFELKHPRISEIEANLTQATENYNEKLLSESEKKIIFTEKNIQNLYKYYLMYVDSILVLLRTGSLYPNITSDAIIDSQESSLIALENKLLQNRKTSPSALESISSINDIQVDLNALMQSTYERHKKKLIDHLGSVLPASLNTALENWYNTLKSLTRNDGSFIDAVQNWNSSVLAELNEAWKLASDPFQHRDAVAPHEVESAINIKPENSFTVTNKWLYSNIDLQSITKISSELDRSFNKSFLLDLIQASFLFAAITASVFYAYEEDFIGRTKDLIGLFIFSFSLDISVSTLSGTAVRPRQNT